MSTMGSARRTPAWIVCRGRTLHAREGLIDCPLRGRVSPELCVTCHYLETLEAERDATGSCSADGEPAPYPTSDLIGAF
jgi:hypothetical protein